MIDKAHLCLSLSQKNSLHQNQTRYVPTRSKYRLILLA